MAGIFIAKGMTIRIPIGGLQLSSSETKVTTVHLGFDVCTPWLELALDHLRFAQMHNSALLAAWKTTNSANQGEALRSEFKSAMQTFTCAAFALDAFYSALKSKMEPLNEIGKSKGRASRFAQIAELFKVAFGQSKNGFETTRSYLEQIYKFRDQAVHPSNDFESAILHPQLNVGLGRHFIAFRYETALHALFVTLEIIGQLVDGGNPANEEIKKYAEYLKPTLTEFRSNAIFSELKDRRED